MLLNKQTPLPTEILLLIARLLNPWDLINLAIAIPGLDRQYKPKYWISIKDEHGNTALHICAANQLDNFTISLLERQFDLSLTNQRGQTALHSACQYGHVSSARLLLDSPSSCGLDPNAAATGGTTALHLAIKAGTLSTIQLLLHRGANMHARSSGGYTALHWAVDSGHDRVVELLLSAGTEDILSEQDDLGRTALHLAAWLGRREVVERLLTAGADSGIRDRDGYTPADLAWQSIQGLGKLESPIIQFVSSIYTFVCGTLRRG